LENLAWGAAGVLVGVFATALGQGLVNRFTEWKRHKQWAEGGLSAHFVQARGANGSGLHVMGTDALREKGIEDTNVYRVWLTLDLSSSLPAWLRQVDLRYDWPSTDVEPAEQHCLSYGADLECDYFNRLMDSPRLSANKPLRLEVRRRFLTGHEFTGKWDDYRTFTLRCEIATKAFGPQDFEITGKLETAGEVSSPAVHLLTRGGNSQR